MSHPHPRPQWQNAIILLASTVVTVVIVLTLHWGRPVLIPITVAMLLTVLLTPAVKRLQYWGMNRIFAVLISVCMLAAFFLGLGGMLAAQTGNLLGELPQHTQTIRAKIKSLKGMTSGLMSRSFGQMVHEIKQELHPEPTASPTSAPTSTAPQVTSPSTETDKTEAASAAIPWMLITGYLGSAFEVLGALAFTMVLLVFFLFQREDLRDRVILLAGKAHLSVTSKAIEDITQRVTRYLMMVGAINGGFGALLAAGLFVIGLPYALLWGVLAGALRFIPYLGPWIGAAFPITMSVALSSGWWQPAAVLAYVLFLELICNNVVEPLLYGRTTGVSATALLISAVLWLYLWGPIGLVLSAPFAVCLVVIGKNIPQLSFLNLLLGDQPALTTDVSFYQRLMLGDLHAAQKIIEKQLENSTPLKVIDQLLIPTLFYSNRDYQRNHVSAEDHAEMLADVRTTLQQLKEMSATKEPFDSVEIESTPPLPDTHRRITLLGCPADDETDSLGLEMLSLLLDADSWNLQTVAEETLTSEVLERVKQDRPDIVCIASVPPGGLSQIRYLCKRLRAVSPQLPILVGRWGAKRISYAQKSRLKQAGATFVATSLEETCRLLASQWPLLSNREHLSRHSLSKTSLNRSEEIDTPLNARHEQPVS